MTSLTEQLIPISTPPFCPNPDCDAHHVAPDGRWWITNGWYRTKLSGEVRRFRCTHCGRGFSEQTFHIDFFAKRRVDYGKLIAELTSCCGIRALGRIHGVDHKTVLNKVMRFARQAMAAEATISDNLLLGEDLVVDGFQSFWVSQYFPNNLHLLAGSQSQFVYAVNGVTIRRSGRMTDVQKRLRIDLERRYRADPQALSRSFTEILDVATTLIAAAPGSLPRRLRSDQHETYRRAVAHHGAFSLLLQQGKTSHVTVSSTMPRTASNPLFAVNYLDRELRKDMAEHVRESTRFSRSVHGTMDRLHCYLFMHNLRKPFRINCRVYLRGITHATQAGVPEGLRRRVVAEIYRRRAFRSRTPLIAPLLPQWLRMEVTPLERGRPHLPNYLLA